ESNLSTVPAFDIVPFVAPELEPIATAATRTSELCDIHRPNSASARSDIRWNSLRHAASENAESQNKLPASLVYRLAAGRRLDLQPLDCFLDPSPHRRALAVAILQQMLRHRHGFEHGIRAIALVHEQCHLPDIGSGQATHRCSTPPVSAGTQSREDRP